MGNLAVIDDWHNYFESIGVDVFKVIESAILVARWYRPNEFLTRRAQTAELLFFVKQRERGGSGFHFAEESGYDADDVLANNSKESKTSCITYRSMQSNHQANTQFWNSSGLWDRYSESEVMSESASMDTETTRSISESATMAAETTKSVLESTRVEVEALRSGEEFPTSVENRQTRKIKLCFKKGKQLSDIEDIQKAPAKVQEILKPAHANEEAFELKFEASKRKLQEVYKQAQNAKKKIRLIEFNDLPHLQSSCAKTRETSAKCTSKITKPIAKENQLRNAIAKSPNGAKPKPTLQMKKQLD